MELIEPSQVKWVMTEPFQQWCSGFQAGLDQLSNLTNVKLKTEKDEDEASWTITRQVRVQVKQPLDARDGWEKTWCVWIAPEGIVLPPGTTVSEAIAAVKEVLDL